MKALRPFATSMTAPIVKFIAKTPLSPNALTVIGLLLNFGVAAYIAFVDPMVGGILALVAGAFDMLDGGLARITGKTSAFGAFLDSTLDRASEAVLLLGISARYAITGEPWNQVLVLVALAGSLMVSYTRARAEGLSVSGEVGLLDRPARLIVISAGLITGFIVPALIIVAVLTIITVVQRILFVEKQLRGK